MLLLQVLLVHLAAVASPGPNVLLVTHTAMADSRRAGLFASAGIAVAATLWAAVAAIGVGLLVADSGSLERSLRLVGGCYLVCLGLRTIRASRPRLAAGAPRRERSSPARAWRRGLLTNLTNPKAAVFYLSVFATLIPGDASTGLRMGAVGVIAAGALAWHALIALAFSTRRAQAAYGRARPWIDAVAGLVMIGFGLTFALGLL